MEERGSDLMQEVIDDGGGGDGFYEEIVAPKYVDFTVPDLSRPDDRSWFCMRVGCDQTHEDVDPEALNRSFFLRVMAARSPNIKLQKGLNRQAPSLIPKCPSSAPVKPVKDRIARLSTMTSIPEKIANKKLKDHPIAKLRSIPKPQPTTAKKALTTPRSKKFTSKQEVFRSVRHQKEPVAAPKTRSVAKALFLSTPKKEAENHNASTSQTPVSEVCAEMKRLNVSSLNYGTRGQICKPSRCAAYDSNCKGKSNSQACKPQMKGDKAAVSPKKNLKEGIHKDSSKIEVDGKLSSAGNVCEDHSLGISISDVEIPPSSVVPVVEEPLFSGSNTAKGSEEELEEKVAVHQSTGESGPEKQTLEIAIDTDDNKENASETHSMSNENINTTESEGSQVEASENLPHKEIKFPSKVFQERPPQGVKCKKMRSTNPKPFRLRTDERGILKEANLERRLQAEAQRETVQLVKFGDRMQQNGSHRPQCHVDFDKGVQNAKEGGVQNSKPMLSRRACVKQLRLADPKISTRSSQCQKFENSKENSKKIEKLSSSLLAARKAVVYRLGRETGTWETTSRRKVARAPNEPHGESTSTTTAISSRERKVATIPKEPKFHRIHVPKSCTKRPKMVC